ncbi:(2Fe-2S)-binding protein [Massilia antarctica]
MERLPWGGNCRTCPRSAR